MVVTQCIHIDIYIYAHIYIHIYMYMCTCVVLGVRLFHWYRIISISVSALFGPKGRRISLYWLSHTSYLFYPLQWSIFCYIILCELMKY